MNQPPSSDKKEAKWPPRLWSYYDMTDVFLARIDGAIITDIPSERFASESKLPGLHGNMIETEYLSLIEHQHELRKLEDFWTREMLIAKAEALSKQAIQKLRAKGVGRE